MSEVRTGLMIAVKIPEQIADALMDYPLTTEDKEDLHITLLYIGNAADYDIEHILSVTRGWATSVPKMRGRLGGIGTFDNPNEKVLWASVNIPGLEDAHVSLRKAMEFSGLKIRHVNGYTPHATLSYSEKPFTKFPKLSSEAMEEFSVNDVYVVAGPDWIKVSLAELASKADPVDAVPQERLTSITRGRGPRRGNLEALLDYWRPIMKKPGGFRRCLVILADHPELYPLEPMCAWLHHETTGKWPNEGNRKKKPGKPGKRRVRRVRGGKKSDPFDTVDIRRDSRERGGLFTQPINGRPNVVDFKASLYRSMMDEQEAKVGFVTSRTRTGRAAQSVGSAVVPGDLGDIRHPVRSTIFETLTPGGGGGRGRRRVGLPRVGGDSEGARNKFRCPPGFEKGGTFTNSSFTTCGRQILDIPIDGGPGSLSEAAVQRIRRLAEDASLVRAIGDLRTNRNAFDIVRAAQIPAAPKEVNVKARQSSVDLILEAFDKAKEPSEPRFVRRDGIILRPVVPFAVMSEIGEFDDMNDGVLVVNDIGREAGTQVGQDEVPAMVTGLRATVFHNPGTGSLSLRREGGDLNDADRASLIRSWAASLSAVGNSDDPTAALRKFVDDSGGKFVIDQNLGEDEVDRELVTVQRGKRKITVPRWVFATYLSDDAPRRPDGQAPYRLVDDGGSEAKAMSVFAVKAQVQTEPDVSEFYAPYFGLVKSYAGSFQDLTTDVKIGRARGWFDPNIERFRCPAGTSGGGQITDRFARNCGASLASNLIDRMFKAGRNLGVDRPGAGLDPNAPNAPARGPRRAGGGDPKAFAEKMSAAGHDIGQLRENTNGIVSRVRQAVDAAQKGSGKRGRIGATLGERREQVALSPDQLRDLNGRELSESLSALAEALDEPIYDEAPLELAQELYHDIEKAATAEAGRQEIAPARDREAMRVRGAIDNALDRLIGRVDAPAAKSAGTDEKKPVRRRVFNRLADALQDSNPVDPDARDKPGIIDRARARVGVVPRRPVVPLPELADLDEAKRKRVQAAMLAEFEDLDAMWEDRLGGPDFSFDDINAYIAKMKNGSADKRRIRVLERQRDDWNELYEGTDDEADPDLEDVVGRLSPVRREGILIIADLGNVRSRERERQARIERERQAEAEAAKLEADKEQRRQGRRNAIRRVLGRKEPEANATTGDPFHPASRPHNPDYKGDVLGPRNEHGFVYGPNVPVGNAGIDDVAQAEAHLANGGALADVPDEFIGRAIFANSSFASNTETSPGNSKRFQLISGVDDTGSPEGGVNGMFRFIDTANGENRFVGVKFGQGESGAGYGYNEAFAEVMGAHLGERLGLLQGQVRFDGPKSPDDIVRGGDVYKPTPVVVVDMGQNVVPRSDGVDAKKVLVSPDNKNLDALHVDDAVRISMLDFIQNNVDRHNGNFFLYADPEDPNVMRVYPIDNGLGWQGFSKSGDSNGWAGLQVPDQIRSWSTSYSGAKRNQIFGKLTGGKYGTRDSVVAAIAKTQEDMRRADAKLSFGESLDEIYGLSPDGLDDTADGFRSAVRYAQDRYDWFLDATPDEVYAAMVGS